MPGAWLIRHVTMFWALLAQGRGEGRLIRRRRWQEKVRVRREAHRQQRAADKAAVRVRGGCMAQWPSKHCTLSDTQWVCNCMTASCNKSACPVGFPWLETSNLHALRRQLQPSV